MASPSDFSPLPTSIRTILTTHTTPTTPPFRARTGYTHRTWARTFSSLPELYIQPHTLAEIEHAVTLARHCRRRLTTVGSGHSPSDITCTSSWLLNLDRFSRVLAVDGATGLCTVEAGIRLRDLSAALDGEGLALPNLGSIDEQSVAGAIATGTHGSSLRHGLVSECVVALKVTMADGRTRACSAEERPELFRAALLSVGALGVVTEVTLRAVPAFSLAWSQTIDADARLFEGWEDVLWKQAEFVRVWWFPYMRRAVVWKADRVEKEEIEAGRVRHSQPPTSFQDSRLGYIVYQNLLALARWFPRVTPWIEWFVFGLNYGFRNGESTRVSGCQESYKAFLLNCLYSQFVNEWAIPLHKGPEALQRLGAWLNRLQPGDPGYIDHRIPFSADGLWVHSPVEVRVSDTTVQTDSTTRNNRPFLDITPDDGPALYLNATMYRPYYRDPPHEATERYYRAFEWLMRDLGGRPHWAKTFSVSPSEFATWYGADWRRFCAVRDKADPEGMFVGPWHRRYLLGEGDASSSPSDSSEEGDDEKGLRRLALEEVGFVHEKAKGGGIRVFGRQNPVVPA
ncbi:D-arabinono-1,4-lactone oxidase-domain-containing protein [Chaetomium tenue]|uniref:D-arabinono-1,4-lactone oxidase-domain-containing protein n=1 Tax=Chaetomium tenue TaxID=1854479 RepID=A0ACB7P587_9PEZI|nr:D-arabinono-1,4-lactone oxidase-domain-containing protein [Chaetomium globosum]